MKRGGFASEVELARVVITWLRDEGWEVYQEVEGADIVATKAGQVAVVECKLSLNLTVLGQAWNWRPKAHFVYAAVPRYAGAREGAMFARAACKAIGLGFLEVMPPITRSAGIRRSVPDVLVMVDAQLREPDASRRPLISILQPEHKTFAEAGSPGGRRWSDFRNTEKLLGEHVAANPGVLVRDALKAIRHHWQGKGAASRCVAVIDQGILKGVRVAREDGRVRLYPDPMPASLAANATCDTHPPAPATPPPPPDPTAASDDCNPAPTSPWANRLRPSRRATG